MTAFRNMSMSMNMSCRSRLACLVLKPLPSCDKLAPTTKSQRHAKRPIHVINPPAWEPVRLCSRPVIDRRSFFSRPHRHPRRRESELYTAGSVPTSKFAALPRQRSPEDALPHTSRRAPRCPCKSRRLVAHPFGSCVGAGRGLAAPASRCCACRGCDSPTVRPPSHRDRERKKLAPAPHVKADARNLLADEWKSVCTSAARRSRTAAASMEASVAGRWTVASRLAAFTFPLCLEKDVL
jgi:hypothetical protein